MLNFNPRSRVGNDGNIQADAGSLWISIHVPAWGTTVFCSGRSISCAISIHVPAWGTTKYLFIMYGIVKISIHVPAWGTTQQDGVLDIVDEFQSTFPRGERRLFCFAFRHLWKFQSTFPRGERLQISTIFHLYICISSTNSHFSITSFCIFYLIHFFLICFFQLFMVRIFWGFSVYFWFALYRNNT